MDPSEDPLTPIKQAIGTLHERIMALEKSARQPACSAAQLVIWDKEHDRLLVALQKHRDSWHHPTQAQRDERKRMVARRDKLREHLHIEY